MTTHRSTLAPGFACVLAIEELASTLEGKPLRRIRLGGKTPGTHRH